MRLQVAKADHWPELHALILVVSDEKKKVSSSAGMTHSVKTSLLLAHRAAAVVPPRMKVSCGRLAVHATKSKGLVREITPRLAA